MKLSPKVSIEALNQTKGSRQATALNEDNMIYQNKGLNLEHLSAFGKQLSS